MDVFNKLVGLGAAALDVERAQCDVAVAGQIEVAHTVVLADLGTVGRDEGCGDYQVVVAPGFVATARQLIEGLSELLREASMPHDQGDVVEAGLVSDAGEEIRSMGLPNVGRAGGSGSHSIPTPHILTGSVAAKEPENAKNVPAEKLFFVLLVFFCGKKSVG